MQTIEILQIENLFRELIKLKPLDKQIKIKITQTPLAYFICEISKIWESQSDETKNIFL